MSEREGRKYDAIFIFESGDDKIGSVKTFVNEQLEGARIKVLKEEDLGERSLAYEIKKNERGHYFRYDLEADPAQLKNLQEPFKLRSDILKFVFFRK
jgi:small subunit ribosomal protein S6